MFPASTENGITVVKQIVAIVPTKKFLCFFINFSSISLDMISFLSLLPVLYTFIFYKFIGNTSFTK